MEKASRTDRLSSLADLCRQNGLKVTPQRLAILEQLTASKSHPTADTVFRLVRKEFPGLSFDTVNRSLMTFAEAGIADVVEGQGGARRFDPDTAPHHHFHCEKCGVIIDFKCPAFDTLDIPKEIEEKFQVLKKRLVLKGLCDVCRPGKPLRP